MAITFDAANASGGKNVTTHPTISHTIGSGSDRMLAAWALEEDPVTQALVSSYTYNGTPLVLSHSRLGDSKAGGFAYYLGEGSLPVGGAYNLVLTWNSNCQDSMAGCISLAGVKDQAPEATGANGSALDQSSGSASITTITANAWVLIGNVIGGNYALSYDTSTQRATGNTTGANASIGDEAFATTGAKSIGWTATSARYWTMLLMAFEAAGGANNGTSAVTLADAVGAASGQVLNSGSSAVTLDNVTAAGTGTIGAGANNGTSSATLDDVTAAGTGEVAVSGSSAVTLDNVVAAGSGSVGAGANNGTSAVTLADAVGSANGKVLNSGSSAVTLEDAAAAGTGKAGINGSSAITLEDFIASGAGAVKVTGSSATVLEDAVQSGSGAVLLSGQSAVTLEDNPATGSGKVLNSGASAVVLDNVAASGSGTIGTSPNNGTSAVTLADVSAAGSGQVLNNGISTVVLDNVISVGYGSNNASVINVLRRYTPILAQDRYAPIEYASRYFAVFYEDRKVRTKVVKTFEKDAPEILDYTFDFAAKSNDALGVSPYTDFLASGETLTTKTITSPAGIAVDSSAFANGNTAVKVVLSGGTIGDDDYRIECLCDTSNNNKVNRSIKIRMKQL